MVGGMTPEELRNRLKAHALQILKLTGPLMSDVRSSDVARQVRRSALGALANYRAAGRGRSGREFCAKLGVALEECDETELWLEILRDANLAAGRDLTPLLVEAGELTRILSRSYQTASKHLRSGDRVIR